MQMRTANNKHYLLLHARWFRYHKHLLLRHDAA
jgi:hypothetical protein